MEMVQNKGLMKNEIPEQQIYHAKQSLSPQESQVSSILAEPCINPEEFQRIVDYACALHKIDAERQSNNQRGLEILAAMNSREGIPRSIVTQVIEQHMDIGKEYTLKALDILFPSPEQMRADIDLQQACASRDVVREVYKKEFVRAFQTAFPTIHVQTGGEGCYGEGDFIQLNYLKKKEYTSFFGRKKEKFVQKGEILARWYVPDVGNYCAWLQIYNPVFLRVCGATLDKLKARFGRGFDKITYYYDPKA